MSPTVINLLQAVLDYYKNENEKNNKKESGKVEQSSSFHTNLAKQLDDEEGNVLHAYQDHLGYWTIGRGRLIDRRKGGGISKEESDYLFNNDVNIRLEILQKRIPWFNQLNDARKAVLLGMSFQMGVDGLFGFRNTLAMIEKGDYSSAARGMLNSKWATQTPERAGRMAKQMLTGEWQFQQA